MDEIFADAQLLRMRILLGLGCATASPAMVLLGIHWGWIRLTIAGVLLVPVAVGIVMAAVYSAEVAPDEEVRNACTSVTALLRLVFPVAAWRRDFGAFVAVASCGFLTAMTLQGLQNQPVATLVRASISAPLAIVLKYVPENNAAPMLNGNGAHIWTANLHACDNGNLAACANLAFAYERGLAGTQDEAKATQLYIRACRGKFDESCKMLGNLAVWQKATSREDVTSASDALEDACARDDVDACFYAALLLQRDTKSLAASLFAKACKLGERSACSIRLYDNQSAAGGSTTPDIKIVETHRRSDTDMTNGHDASFDVIAQCPREFPRRVSCEFKAHGNTGKDDPLSMTSGDHARTEETADACICHAHHGKKTLFGAGHWIECWAKATCARQ